MHGDAHTELCPARNGNSAHSLAQVGVPWWIMWEFWTLWKQEGWNNAVTTKVTTEHKAPLATRPQGVDAGSQLCPSALPSPSQSSLKLDLCPRKSGFSRGWARSCPLRLCQGGSTWTGQGRVSRGMNSAALLHIKHLQPGVFTPNFSPLWNPLAVPLGPQPNPRGAGSSSCFLRGLCSRWVQGTFTGLAAHRWGLFRLKRAFFWTFNRSPAWEMVPPCPFL